MLVHYLAMEFKERREGQATRPLYFPVSENIRFWGLFHF